MIRTILAAALLAALAACGTETAEAPAPLLTRAASQSPAKALFGGQSTPAAMRPAVHGGYSAGCVAGAVQLPETGPTWQAMRLSRNRNWAHPVTVDFVQDLSRAAARAGWRGLYVGDMSQPRGGPMLTGHVSHQSGLDADVWMKPALDLSLTRAEREAVSSDSMRRANGAYVNAAWTPTHHAVLRAAASDPRVSRILVFPGAKVQMCDDETGDRAYLRKIRPYYGHHYHFHVRLHCPRGEGGCTPQDAPPPGDGCAEARRWQADILNPPPPDPDARPAPPRRELTLGDLPAQCAAVLASD